MINSLKGIKPGMLFTETGTQVWEVVSMCELPTITLRNLRTKEEVGGAVGCLNLENFVPLVMQQPADLPDKSES